MKIEKVDQSRQNILTLTKAMFSGLQRILGGKQSLWEADEDFGSVAFRN